MPLRHRMLADGLRPVMQHPSLARQGQCHPVQHVRGCSVDRPAHRRLVAGLHGRPAHLLGGSHGCSDGGGRTEADHATRCSYSSLRRVRHPAALHRGGCAATLTQPSLPCRGHRNQSSATAFQIATPWSCFNWKCMSPSHKHQPTGDGQFADDGYTPPPLWPTVDEASNGKSER